jgi:hydrogenase maturation protease
MARVLVLGYGNPLRSDDGVGWQVAVELFRANTSPEVHVLPCHQLTPDLAEAASFAETVIFIDATRKGKPGEIRCEEVFSQPGPASFTHDLSPAGLLAVAAELFGVCPQGYLFSIAGECFAAGQDLSSTVSSRVPELKVMVRERIAEALAPSSQHPRPQSMLS